MPFVCEALLAFVLAHTAYELPHASCPRFEFVDQKTVCAVLDDHPQCKAVAAYAYDSGTVYMIHDVDLTSPCQQSWFVHEITHGVQDQAGVLEAMIEETRSNPALRNVERSLRYSRSPHEREAIKVQNQYLNKHGMLAIGAFAPDCTDR